MKKILLATLALAVMFTSCSKEDNGGNETQDNVIVVKLPDNVSLRAVEAQGSAASTITLANVTVFLLNGNNVVGAPKTFSGPEITAKSKRIEQASSSVNKVVVVANIPAGDMSAVNALTTETAIKNYAFAIADQNSGIAAVTRMGTGTPATAVDLTPDGHNYKAVSVELEPLTARFEIGAVKAGNNVANVTLEGVWINAYYTNGSKATVKTHNDADPVWYTTPATTSSPFNAAVGTVTMTNTYTVPSYYNAASPLVTMTAGSQVYAYQLFAGANIPHLILLVKGEYTTADASGNKFFLGYVTFTRFTESGTDISSVLPNTIYKVGVGDIGIEINADDITIWPEMQKFDLGVTVTTTPWTVKNVTPNI